MSTYLLLVFLFLFLYSKFYGRCHLTVDVPFFYILLFGAFHSLSLIVQPVINRITVLVIDFRIGTDKSQLFRWQHTLLRQRNRYRNCSPDKSMPDSNFVPSAVWHSAVLSPLQSPPAVSYTHLDTNAFIISFAPFSESAYLCCNFACKLLILFLPLSYFPADGFIVLFPHMGIQLSLIHIWISIKVRSPWAAWTSPPSIRRH